MTDQLLPCPFCGKSPRTYTDGDVTCETKRCPASYFYGPPEDWNTRAQPAASEPKPVEGYKHVSTTGYSVVTHHDHPPVIPGTEWLAPIPLFTHPAPAGVVPDKYDEVLMPFIAMMRAELHANSGKGDRPGWLGMTAEQCLLEIYYHVSKLQKAVRDGNGDRITENTADVANMAMMLADICGALEVARLNK